MGLINVLLVIVRASLAGLGSILWLVAASVIWTVCAATVILFPFGTAWLYIIANRIAYQQPLSLGELLVLTRAYARPAVLWTLLNALVLAALYLVLRYDPVSGRVPSALRALLTILALVWLILQFYAWPLLLEQPDKRLLAVFRSALLLMLAAPDFTLVLFIVVAILVALIVITLPYGLLGSSCVALLGSTAVLDRLHAYGHPPDPRHVFGALPPDEKRPGV